MYSSQRGEMTLDLGGERVDGTVELILFFFSFFFFVSSDSLYAQSTRICQGKYTQGSFLQKVKR